MGSICGAPKKPKLNPVEQMIRKNNMNNLIDQWPTSFIYLLKQKFQTVAFIDEDQIIKKKEGLDFQAFMKLFPRMKQQPQDIQWRAFQSFDVDESSRIDFKEFCSVLSLIINSDENQRAAFIFQLYDVDNDEALSKGEFKYFLKANHQYLNPEGEQKELLDPRLGASDQQPPSFSNQKRDTSVKRIQRVMTSMFDLQNKEKLKLSEFQEWVSENFDLIRYFEIFELVPGPLKEREIIRASMKNQSDDKALSQKQYYVISYKWWERWRFYINYSFAQRNRDNVVSLKEKSEDLKLTEHKVSRKPSNVSIVDLDLGNTIPSEMKEDYSINRKLAKQNPQSVPINELNGPIVSPGKLMRNAKTNYIASDQIEFNLQAEEIKLSPTFRDENKHKHSRSNPIQVQESQSFPHQMLDQELGESRSGKEVFHSIEIGRGNKFLLQVQKKGPESDPEPIISQPQDIPLDVNMDSQPEGIDQTQGQQGSSRKPDPIIIPNQSYESESPKEKHIPASMVTDPLRHLPVDGFKYGICETEENDVFNRMMNNEENYLSSLRPGQIDNSDLQGEYEGELKPNILNNHDYVLVPEEAWNSLVQWYGCNSQVYKRKVFTDPKRNTNILDMYPPYLIGYMVDKRGMIISNKPISLMNSGRKTIQQMFNKFKKRFKLGQIKQYQVFYKRIGELWSEVGSIESQLIEYQMDSGTLIAFVKRNAVQQFRLCNLVYENNVEFVKTPKKGEPVQVKLGDLYDVMCSNQNDTSELKLCVVYEINDNGARFHIKKESYMNDFFLDEMEIKRRVEWPGIKSRNEITRTPQNQIPGMALSSKLSQLYPGLGNQGNTCFMNTILQCVMHTPLFRDYLQNRSYTEDLVIRKKDLKIQQYLVVELAKLIQSLSNKNNMTSYTPYELKKAVDTLLPQFSGYEQHDAQEFLSLYLDAMSDELKRVKREDDPPSFSSVIQELFMGKTINELQCLGCGHKSARSEDYFTLSLPIPIQDEVNFEVTFVGRCTKSYIPPLKKFGIKVNKYGTLRDFISTFERVSGIPSTRVDFIEVYRNNIHKQLYNIDAKTTIRHLGMKPYDQIYAYETLKQSKDIDDEALQIMKDITPFKKSHWEVNDYVDVFDNSNEWRIGQVKEKREKGGTDTYYRIQVWYEKSNVTSWIPNNRQQIAPYRTRTLQSSSFKKFASKLNVVNRIIKQNSDTLERFAIPFIITVPGWLSWKEFRYLIYLQAKRFIDFHYLKKKSISKVKDMRGPHVEDYSARIFFRQSQHFSVKDEDNKFTHITKDDRDVPKTTIGAQSVYLGEAKVGNNCTLTEQNIEHMGRRFHDDEVVDDLKFLAQSDFPYKLRLIDPTTLCCFHCEKPITYQKAKLNNDMYCKGCEPDLVDAPLNLNPTHNNLPLIALDWITLSFNPNFAQTTYDASYQLLVQEKTQGKDKITEEECFNLLTAEEKFEIQCDNCKQIQPATTKFFLSQMPNILILHLKRFQFRDGFLEKIENDIDFPLKSLNLSKWVYQDPNRKSKDTFYDLYAVANHMGNGQEGHYNSYVCVEHESQELWLNFDDEQVRILNPAKIMSQYTYLLFYRRREFPSSTIVNLTYRSFVKKRT